MSRASRSVPLHKGRHRAIRPDQVGRALRRALVATLAPAVVLGLAGWIVVRTSSGRLLDLFLIDKALYELNYELNNRPDWVRIPLRGLAELL